MPDTTRQKKQTRAASNNRSPQSRLSADASASEAALDYFTEYARERPEIVAMWAFGLGFVLGWKLRILNDAPAGAAGLPQAGGLSARR